MITGAHVMLYDQNADALRLFFRDVLEFEAVDAGGGWLILKLPPAELGVHPTDSIEGSCELYLMCDDLRATMATLAVRGVTCGPVQSVGWGERTTLEAPGGRKIGLYQPRHPTAHSL
jgi:hypothetical protein